MGIKNKPKISMWWNFFRWQCVNTKIIDNYKPGEIIDEDEFTGQMMKLLRNK